MSTPKTPENPDEFDEIVTPLVIYEDKEQKKEQEKDIQFRETADYIKNIGPEDADEDVIEEGLENYGFDLMDESHFESEVTAASDNPDWMNEQAKKRADADFPHNENPDGMYENDV
ncbi:MAG: hypothetical protein RLP44_01280 [Aggregatilineales bacterium]